MNVAHLTALLAQWGVETGVDDPAEIWSLVSGSLGQTPDKQRVWQLYSVALLEYPSQRQYRTFVDDLRLYGPEYAVKHARAGLPKSEGEAPPMPTEIRFVAGETWLDINDTSRSGKTTGVQRVVREVARRWVGSHGARLVAWNAGRRNLDGGYLRALDDDERDAFLNDKEALHPAHVRPLLIPTSGRVLIAEVTTDVWRASRTAALAEHAGVDVGFIVHDLVPLTAGDTSTPGIAGQFPLYLEALAHAKRIATTSEATHAEFAGWKRMLPSVGSPGPEIGLVPLAAEPLPPSTLDAAAFRRRAGVDVATPVVLVVGSHEPRKNHLAVLHAAELLWRKRLSFSLVFIGGMGWKAEAFEQTVHRLQRQRRPVVLLTDADDDVLSAAYSAASFTVFPSLHEGFGLPVAESLAAGAPVVTSAFGSTEEIARIAGGALLVDPRSDSAIADSIERLLSDEGLRLRLAAEAASMPIRRWDDYAAEAWSFLTA